MRRAASHLVRHGRGTVLVLLVMATVACDDGFGPQPWNDRPDTTEIYSLARAQHIGLPGAYNFHWPPGRVVVEQQRIGSPAVFDLAFTEMEEGFVAMPAGLFESFTIRPGLQAQPQEDWESLTRVPREGYVTDEVVPLDSGVVYAVRTRSAPNGCNFFGKFQVLGLDSGEGVVRIRAMASPICNDRSLVPPDAD